MLSVCLCYLFIYLVCLCEFCENGENEWVVCVDVVGNFNPFFILLSVFVVLAHFLTLDVMKIQPHKKHVHVILESNMKRIILHGIFQSNFQLFECFSHVFFNFPFSFFLSWYNSFVSCQCPFFHSRSPCCSLSIAMYYVHIIYMYNV